jgi:hypothetical protein
MEGPQAAVLLVSVLLALWAAVPWIDRQARQDRASPLFTDLGAAALIFIGYLTLKAWDIGGGGAKVPDPAAVSRATAVWTLAGTAVATAVRALAFKHRAFLLSGTAALHVALNGLFGLSYLTAGVASALVALLIAGALIVRNRAAAQGAPGGAP